MRSLIQYIKEVVGGFYSLSKGLMLTLKYFVRPWKHIVEQYPENRTTSINIPERFAGEVVMPHDENNNHKCTACTLCEMACPNGSIKIISATIETEDGKKKKVIDKWVYNLGMCTFCAQCIEACPQDAITMKNSFELSVYNRNDLIKVLNKPGSKLKEKES
ncbi:MAG TPA: NADH-quinone oxidoreductase subunit I [Bacteroidales bacterium]|nr:NADH-quinone oxidoreductase subunit I [Bacteroidales bacterium]